MFVSELQPEKTPQPISVTLEGMVMLVSEAQLMNAASPMLVTCARIVILVSEVQSLNAESSMISPPVMTTSLRFLFKIYFIANVGIVALSIGQSSNAPQAILVTLFGTVIFVSPAKP